MKQLVSSILICTICEKWPSKTTKLAMFIGACFHMQCLGCIKRHRQACKICRKRVKFMHINKEMPQVYKDVLKKATCLVRKHYTQFKLMLCSHNRSSKNLLRNLVIRTKRARQQKEQQMQKMVSIRCWML